MTRSLTLVAAAALAVSGLSACASDSVFEVQVGQCAVQDEIARTSDGYIEELPTVDCEEPHDLEAYAAMDMQEDEFPGEEAAQAQADEFCWAEFENFVGMDYADSEIYFTYFYPEQDSWDRLGDREILCLLWTEELVTGSLEGANR